MLQYVDSRERERKKKGGGGGQGEICNVLFLLNGTNDDASVAHSDGIAAYDTLSFERSKTCDFDPY